MNHRLSEAGVLYSRRLSPNKQNHIFHPRGDSISQRIVIFGCCLSVLTIFPYRGEMRRSCYQETEQSAHHPCDGEAENSLNLL